MVSVSIGAFIKGIGQISSFSYFENILSEIALKQFTAFFSVMIPRLRLFLIQIITDFQRTC